MTFGPWENVYSNPEKLGLRLVGEVSFDDDSYQFDLGAVWWHPERRVFFYATDNGCSCPSPFEDFQDVESLGEPLTLDALTTTLRSLSLPTPDRFRILDTPLPVQVAPIIDRARELAS